MPFFFLFLFFLVRGVFGQKMLHLCKKKKKKQDTLSQMRGERDLFSMPSRQIDSALLFFFSHLDDNLCFFVFVE